MIQREIFGPVITVQPFSDEDEAIAWANGTHVRPGLLGLDPRRRPRPARVQGAALRLRVDQRPHPARVGDAARRLQQSGYGKDLSMYALEDYTQVKHVMAVA